ncbi:type VII secretion protein EccE [Mycobacteroides saopaulense]|uniref:Type VII secretion protein EccE n=1 Tax=Mycobacteroides saopaulense TaxID=1578165 RepID=A0A1S4VSK1_9MYCO|nr:type VII secretion protein EccE [Mycobacteroides saopaulense]ALR11663.1 secretion protein EccE [Mycobacteroides saopaulense]ORB52556.1 type VII secretion protein EccE [Mycobacteroides saopaulense]
MSTNESKKLKLYRPPVPGTLRLTLVATLIAMGAFALYRRDPADRWIAITAGVLALVLLVWWRGTFLTDLLGRFTKLLARRISGRTPAADTAQVVTAGVDARSTVALELTSPESGEEVPIGLIAGYLDRYGVRCSSIRVTTADVGAESKTWVSLTLGAAANLTALQARSPRIPLRETADTVARRLADHLRELGWHVNAAESPNAPLPVQVKEGSRGVIDDHGYLAAYRATVNGELPETLRDVWSAALPERWTVLELTGTTDAPHLSVVCALRTEEKPAPRAPLAGLTPCWGEHLLVLRAMDPLSSSPLRAANANVTPEFLDKLAQRNATPALV